MPQKSRPAGVGSVAIGTGFSGASTINVWNRPFTLLGVRLVRHDGRIAGSGAACASAGNGGDQLMRESSLGLVLSLRS